MQSHASVLLLVRVFQIFPVVMALDTLSLDTWDTSQQQCLHKRFRGPGPSVTVSSDAGSTVRTAVHRQPGQPRGFSVCRALPRSSARPLSASCAHGETQELESQP